jgi:hypothetical protein
MTDTTLLNFFYYSSIPYFIRVLQIFIEKFLNFCLIKKLFLIFAVYDLRFKEIVFFISSHDIKINVV